MTKARLRYSSHYGHLDMALDHGVDLNIQRNDFCEPVTSSIGEWPPQDCRAAGPAWREC